MFSDDRDTDNWEIDLELDNYTLVKNEEFVSLTNDSNMLYALRKIGAVTTELEDEALEFLRDEGAGV